MLSKEFLDEGLGGWFNNAVQKSGGFINTVAQTGWLGQKSQVNAEYAGSKARYITKWIAAFRPWIVNRLITMEQTSLAEMSYKKFRSLIESTIKEAQTYQSISDLVASYINYQTKGYDVSSPEMESEKSHLGVLIQQFSDAYENNLKTSQGNPDSAFPEKEAEQLAEWVWQLAELQYERLHQDRYGYRSGSSNDAGEESSSIPDAKQWDQIKKNPATYNYNVIKNKDNPYMVYNSREYEFNFQNNKWTDVTMGKTANTIPNAAVQKSLNDLYNNVYANTSSPAPTPPPAPPTPPTPPPAPTT